MAGNTNDQGSVPVDPEVADKAQKDWVWFTKATKYSVIVICAILALMAVFLV